MQWILPITLLILVPFVNCQTCPTGWRELGGRCYLEVSEGNLPRSLEARRLHCLQRRGDLAKFDPPSTFDQFQLGIDFSEYYIGLTDQEIEGDFRWIRDNTVPSSFPWGFSQPNGGAAENCVVVSGNPAVWSDTACNRPLPFICERPAENPPCGVGPLTSRIVGGSDAGVGEWPWYGTLRLFGILPNCGVTLISEEWAITAAHCASSLDYTVVFGQITSENDPPSPNRQESDVTWFRHPRYNPVTLENDIALLYLHTPVTLTNFVRTACMYDTLTNPDEDSSPPELTELTNCHIVGLGHTVDGFFSPPDVLQEAPVEIFPPSSCSNYGNNFIEEIMLCAGNGDFSVDSCSGDSGGGLICQSGDTQLWTLAGITSFGFGCGLEGFPGIYTRLATTRSFVDSIRSSDSLFRCPGSGQIILDNQACNNIVDCDDYGDEIGCGDLEIGQVFELSSPKFGMVTNLINRRWIFFPPPNQVLSVTITNNNLVPDSGFLDYLTNIDGALPQTVPAVSSPLFPFTFTSEGLGTPIVLSMEKTAINSVAGFQATIRVA
ncbi:Transmembrane protease serine 9 [Holothuria leucospilota]|uniref:Transmembrane protease serine 9 n=1 Tax=Holothuria leucospilota TaxID=206669 RepID=A0A9Q0YB40_HOLLE|nr:Transmembrane protease serine 9 [Holothuria leucospilota]